MPRTRGRPRLDEQDASVPVHLTLTARDYDETFRRAQRERVTVQEIIRRDLKAGAKKHDLK